MDRNQWNERYRTAELVWTAEPNRFLVAEVADLAPARVLDLAAGEGRNAVWLAEKGWDVTAIDYSDVAIAKAHDLAHSRGVEVEAMVGDATEPLPGAPDVRSRRRRLPATPGTRPFGGTASMRRTPSRPEARCWSSRMTSRISIGGYGGPQDPAVLTGPDAVAAALEGFDIEKAERVEREVETPDGPRVAIDHVVRARRPT